ncbi:tyrosine-type recombinase/integrase [Streptomyces bathyalis]|uniref:Tyrosine-type recombinase/integrase n=1 Tax=Streptomyces bathyalis TaxID=2710756 RepID=A0A7T1T2Q7_9ACTN|nr:tyrosine-type recombinase/integrase [Streptomyces bathyalis]
MKETGLPSGSLYPVLARLERAGWLRSCREAIDPGAEGRPQRRYYELTPDGLVEARRELAVLSEQLRPPGGLIDKGTKGKRRRFVPSIPEIRPLVASRLEAVGRDPMARLFTGPRGGRISTAVLRDATHWDEVVVRLGYEHLRRHDLRHTGLTWMADAGVPLHVLRKIARHGSLSTTQRYLHPDHQSVELAGAALNTHLLAGRTASGPQVVPKPPPQQHLRIVR